MSLSYTAEPQEHITIFTLTHTDDETVTAWASDVETIMSHAEDDNPFYILIDAAYETTDFIPLLRQSVVRLCKTYRHKRGFVAFIFGMRTAPYVIRLFFATMGKLDFRINFFHERKAAEKWLYEVYYG